MNRTALEKIIEIVRTLEPLDAITVQITADTRISELKLDSLEFLELVMAIEDEFSIEISDDQEDALWAGTIGDLVALTLGQADRGA